MQGIKFRGALGAIGVAALLSPTAASAGADEPVAAASEVEAAAGKGTSGVCFNEGFLTKGTEVDYNLTFTGAGVAMTRRFTLEVKGKGKFNGVKAVETEVGAYADPGKPPTVSSAYSNLKNGKLLNYGSDSKEIRVLFEPPTPQPIAMKQGKSFKSEYKITNTYSGGPAEVVTAKKKYTFDRIETLKFSVGRFKACRFSSRISQRSGRETKLINQIDWVAAEGKYRGFTLRTKARTTASTGGSFDNQIDVTKIRKFKVK